MYILISKFAFNQGLQSTTKKNLYLPQHLQQHFDTAAGNSSFAEFLSLFAAGQDCD